MYMNRNNYLNDELTNSKFSSTYKIKTATTY
jgi:hypothetical protein